jgi:choline dehydrogenase-like flavoprotein
VLLLEAGGTERRLWVTVPIGYGRTFTSPAVNWMYQGEPDAALDGRRAFVPRGKLLGGSGAINAMVYVRGQPHDYDDWRAITATAPLADYNAGEFLPGAAARSHADRLADFRRRAWSVFHPVGTCAMGPDPATALVDARLRMHGIEALRIVDASIFPSVTSGNTNAPTIMVAEKGAALIAEDE